MASGEHHQSHNAFAIDFFPVFFHGDVGLETVGGFHELGCWPGMDAEFVDDREFFLRHGVIGWREPRSSGGVVKGKFARVLSEVAGLEGCNREFWKVVHFA